MLSLVLMGVWFVFGWVVLHGGGGLDFGLGRLMVVDGFCVFVGVLRVLGCLCWFVYLCLC